MGDRLYLSDLAAARGVSPATLSSYLSAARTGNRKNVLHPPPQPEPDLERMPSGGYRRWWDASRADVQEWINNRATPSDLGLPEENR